MFRKAHQSMWSILSLLIGNLVDPLVSYAILFICLIHSSLFCRPDFNGSNFHGCIWTLPDHKSMSSSLLHIGWSMNFRKPWNKLDDFSNAPESLMVMKTSSPNMTSQIPKYSFLILARPFFWFVFVKLSETVGFSYLEHHGLCKTYFLEWSCFLLV